MPGRSGEPKQTGRKEWKRVVAANRSQRIVEKSGNRPMDVMRGQAEDDEKAADMLRTRERIHGVPCWLFGSYATSLFTDFFSFSLP